MLRLGPMSTLSGTFGAERSLARNEVSNDVSLSMWRWGTGVFGPGVRYDVFI